MTNIINYLFVTQPLLGYVIVFGITVIGTLLIVYKKNKMEKKKALEATGGSFNGPEVIEPQFNIKAVLCSLLAFFILEAFFGFLIAKYPHIKILSILADVGVPLVVSLLGFIIEGIQYRKAKDDPVKLKKAKKSIIVFCIVFIVFLSKAIVRIF